MTLARLRRLFAPSPPRPRLRDDEVRRLYPRYRWGILEATFIGYAVFYLVRNNLSTVTKEIEGALRYDHSMIGDILAATAITYGLGKLVMGALSDRSNPRLFMPVGLLLTAACNFAFGAVAGYRTHLLLWSLNGFIQGMGWPPCGRSMGHWFSQRERGTIFAFWNIAHNVGGALAGVIAAHAAARWGWQYAFHVPALLAVVCALYLLWRLRDTPQSVGLPPIEEHNQDFPAASDRPPPEGQVGTGQDRERELTTRELLLQHILHNGRLWLVALANFFVYIVRYSMLDWGPVYLREVKRANLQKGGFSVALIELGGIPSTILAGWLSNRAGGRRGMVSLLCMIPVLAAFAGILLNPPGRLWLDLALLCVVGFFVYPPVMLLGVSALDLTSKKAVGTAAGFVGLFGYVGRTVQAKGLGTLAHHVGASHGVEAGWNAVIWTILVCAALSVAMLAFTWRIRPRA